MVDPGYCRARAERYFRIARAKSDRKMAARMEALGREFLARAEGATTHAALAGQLEMTDVEIEAAQHPGRLIPPHPAPL